MEFIMNNQKNKPVVSTDGADTKNAIFNEIKEGGLVEVTICKERKGKMMVSDLVDTMITKYSYNKEANAKELEALLVLQEKSNTQEVNVSFIDAYLGDEYILSTTLFTSVVKGCKTPMFLVYLDAQNKRLKKALDNTKVKYFNCKADADSAQQLFLQMGKPIDFVTINPTKEAWKKQSFVVDYMSMSRYEELVFIGFVGHPDEKGDRVGASILISSYGSIQGAGKKILDSIIQEVKGQDLIDTNKTIKKILNSEEGDQFAVKGDRVFNVMPKKELVQRDKYSGLVFSRFYTEAIFVEKKFKPQVLTIKELIGRGEIQVRAKRARRIDL